MGATGSGVDSCTCHKTFYRICMYCTKYVDCTIDWMLRSTLQSLQMSKRVYPQNPSVPLHHDVAQHQGYPPAQQGYPPTQQGYPPTQQGYPPAQRPVDGYGYQAGQQTGQQFLTRDQSRSPHPQQQWPPGGLSSDFQRMQLTPQNEGTKGVCGCGLVRLFV